MTLSVLLQTIVILDHVLKYEISPNDLVSVEIEGEHFYVCSHGLPVVVISDLFESDKEGGPSPSTLLGASRCSEHKGWRQVVVGGAVLCKEHKVLPSVGPCPAEHK